MCVQVIYYQSYLFRILIILCNFVQEFCPIFFCLSLCDTDNTLAAKRFNGHENIAHSTTCIFIIFPFTMPGLDRQWPPCVADQLTWRFVHAHHRTQKVIWPLINIKHKFHLCNKITIMFRWNYPLLFFPGL